MTISLPVLSLKKQIITVISHRLVVTICLGLKPLQRDSSFELDAIAPILMTSSPNLRSLSRFLEKGYCGHVLDQVISDVRDLERYSL